MFPHDIPMKRLALPPGDRRPAVVVSGASLRHLRFGYLLQERFPGLLARWWVGGGGPGGPPPVPKARRALEMLRKGQLAGLARKVVEVTVERRADRRFERDQRAAEERMFGAEVDRLRAKAPVHPCPVADVNGDGLLGELRSVDPYFLLSLGGPLLSPRVFTAVRGIAVNQHSGWSPEYKGAYTPHQALYHRDLPRVGNTVHLLATGADCGPILRRSSVKLHPDDSLHDAFMAAIALGTDLTLEVLGTALHAEELPLFEQPHRGETYLTADLTRARRVRLERDFRSGWLGEALADEQVW